MSADYLGATLVVPSDPTTINLDAGIEALNNAELDDYPLLDDTLEIICGPDIDPNGELKALQTYFTSIIEKIVDLAKNGADDIYWAPSENSSHKTICTGGFSYGDAPTESADIIWKSEELPPAVFQALNIR